MQMHKALIGAVMGAGVLAFSASGALAYVACTGSVCWHAKERYTYPADGKVVIHEDSWKPAAGIKFREHEGRGYWKGDAWTDF
jgi:hypothetical protein